MPPVIPYGSDRDPGAAKKRSARAAPLTTKNLTQHQEEIWSAVEQPAPRLPSDIDMPVSNISDNGDPSNQTDPFEWTRKYADFQARQRRNLGKQSEDERRLLMRQLAEPLNHGKGLPGGKEAIELINDRLMNESTLQEQNKAILHDQNWAFTKTLPQASQDKQFFSVDRWSGQARISGKEISMERPHDEIPSKGFSKQAGTPSRRLPSEQLGVQEYPEDSEVGLPKSQGGKLPKEIMDFNPEAETSMLEDPLEFNEPAEHDKNQVPFIFGETPALQAMMSAQIEEDLGRSQFP